MGRVAAGVAALVLVVAAVVYVLVAPGKVVSSYREDAEPAQEKVAAATTKVFKSFEGEVFNPPAAEAARGGGLEAARKEIRGYEEELDAVEGSISGTREAIDEARPALTEVDVLPLTGGLGSVSDAEEIAAEESTYLADAESYLDEYEAVVEFTRSAIAVDEQAFEAVTAVDPNASLAATKRAVAEARQGLEDARADLEALQPPPPLEELHANALETADVYVDSYGRIEQAFESLDIQAFNSAQADFDEATKELGRKAAELQKEFVEDSALRASIDDLEKQQSDLTERLAAL